MLLDLLSWAKKELKCLGPEESRVNAEQLLAETLGLDRSGLYLKGRESLSLVKEKKFRRLVSRRKQRIPLAYLLGRAYFFNEVLEVNRGCLIPRPETQILVEQFVDKSGFKKNDSFSFLDLGSGSGAIGIALLRHYPNAEAVFSDISRRALSITKKNLQSYGLLGRSQFFLSDLFEKLKFRWDAIISNPPYLSWKDLKRAQPEILREPRKALDGGKDGLDYYRKIIGKAPAHLKSKGQLWLEIGMGQAKQVAEMLRASFSEIQVFKDLSSIERVVKARLKS